MDRWKSRGGKSQRRERVSRKKIREEKEPKKEDAGARKVEKPPNTVLFPLFCGSRGLKSRLAKAAGAEPSGDMRDEKLRAAGARSTFRRKNDEKTYKTHQHRSIFGR